MYYVQLWTETSEYVWERIEGDKSEDWIDEKPTAIVEHGYGECPVYFIQNSPDSDSVDGESDYDGLLDNSRELDRLASCTMKGTKANVDPTLHIKGDPNSYSGDDIKKGSSNALICEDAKYLELSGSSVQTSLDLQSRTKQEMLDIAGVVLGDPATLGAKAVSGEALRMLYAPMVAHASDLRGQYGDGIQRLLGGMLSAAQRIQSTPPSKPYTTPAGLLVQEKPSVMVTKEGQKLNPGNGTQVMTVWPEFFAPTSEDVSKSVDAALKANGTLISSETAVRYTAEHFDVEDVEAEIEAIEEEKDSAAERFMQVSGPEPVGANAPEELEDE